jgi:hypothetical protein
MVKKKEPARDYRFTDGKLVQTTDGVIIAVARDVNEFTDRKIDPAKTVALKTLRDDFADYPIDDYYAGEQGIKTEAKNLARAQLMTPLRTVFTAAENVFGVKSKHYKQFGNAALTRFTDDDLIRNARNVVLTGTRYLHELEPEGITEAMMTEIDGLIKAFDDAVDAQLTAERERESASAERVEKGNALYAALVKICNTGKDIWYEVNESKYNDYVIYNTPTGEPELTGKGSLIGNVTDGSGQPVEGALVTILNTELTDETDAEGDYAFEAVPVGKYSMTVQAGGFQTYTDDVVEIFESQETENDIELTPEEPAP